MSTWVEAGFWLKKLVSGLVLLPASPLLVGAIGLVLLRRRPRLGPALIGLALAVLWTFSLPVVANALASSDERRFPPLDPSTPLPPDAAIVVLSGGAQLGATDYGGETLAPMTLVRLRSAVRLAARTHLPILVSGGRLPSAAHAEADLMAESMTRDFRTPVRWIESASLDTDGNARLSVPLLRKSGITTAVLVTDAAHMRRASRAFEAAGMRVVTAPTDYFANAPIDPLSFIPNTNALRRSNWALHEWLGIAWTALRG